MLTSDSRELLLRETRVRFPTLEEREVKITPLEKGGSGRKFYRLHFGDQSIVLVKYDLSRDENRLYVHVGEFLERQGVRVPRIHFHDDAEGLIWMEDLGENDLWSYREESWPARRALYESALDTIAALHALPPETAAPLRSALAPEFNAALYRWEQSYFFENCLGRHFGMAPNEWEKLAGLPALAEMAERLGAFPSVLMHRDFQSQNILIRRGQAYLIDFQGMRFGLAEYDLASLLYDPYVTLTSAEQAELLDYYLERSGRPAGQFQEILKLCAVQRLMQALGAFGFLGHVKNAPAFFEHVEPARRLLHGLASEVPGLAPLAEALASLPTASL